MNPSKNLVVGMLTLVAVAGTPNFSKTLANEVPGKAVSYRPAPGIGDIPMFFEENIGQTEESVRFVGRGRDYSVLVTDSAAVFKLAPSGPDGRSADVRMSWVGASAPASIVAEDPLPGKSNYLLGNDPSAWKTDIPTFGKVRCSEIGPGVDLELYGNGDLVEYDIVVRPGADLGSVTLRFAGADQVRVDDATGDLVVEVNGAELRHSKAVAYQPTSLGKRPIVSRYTVSSSGDVGFEIGDFDPTELLVVDPVVTLVQVFGGASSSDIVTGVATDSSNAVYVAGNTTSIDFEPSPSSIDGSFGGATDAFVVKINASGTVAYATYLGSSGAETSTDLTVDTEGAAYVIGHTNSVDYPTTPGAYRQTFGGDTDGFISKISPSGTALAYSTLLGGLQSDLPRGIAVDGTGVATTVGETYSPDFETLPGAFDRSHEGDLDGFAMKLNPTGTALLQSTFIGGTAGDRASAVDMASNGDLVVVGTTFSNDFPTTSGAFDLVREGFFEEGFVTRLNGSLSAIVFSSYFGRSSIDKVLDVTVDPLDRAVFVGETRSADLPVTAGAPQPVFGGGSEPDGFVARASATGASLEFCTYSGGSDFDFAAYVTSDSTGAFFVSGVTYSPDFPTTAGAFDTSLSGNSDVFVSKYQAAGNLAFTSMLGGYASEEPGGIALSGAGSILLGGFTSSFDFPNTSSIVERVIDGMDGFVTQLSADGTLVTSSTILGGVRALNSGGGDTALSVLSLADGSVMVAGATTSVNFPVTPGGFDIDRGQFNNGYLLHLDESCRTVLSSTVFGGSGVDAANALAQAPDGSVVLVGSTTSPDFPTSPGCLDSTIGSTQDSDAFLLRLSADATDLQYSTFFGGLGADEASAVVVDGSGSAIVTGSTLSADFPISAGAYDSTFSPSGHEAFVSKFSPSASTLDFSTYLGGTNIDKGFAIALDDQGRAVVTGQTASVDFPVTAGAYSMANQGGQDVFVTKLSSTGTAAEFSTYVGAAGSEQPGGLVIDGAGNIVIAGATNSALFPTTGGAFDTTFNGGFVDGFVMALNAAGSQLAFSTLYGGTGDDVLHDLALDSSGNLWACGYSTSTDLPFSPNAYDTTSAGQNDALIVSFGPSVATLRYATIVGGDSNDVFFELVIDGSDSVIATGPSSSGGLTSDVIGLADASNGLLVRFVRSADTPALYIPPTGAWFLRYVNGSGVADSAFSFGAGGSGLQPLAGNWDGVAGDSPGLYDPTTGAFFLRNSNSPGPADVVFTFGPGGADFVPIAGDWNGDGADTVGIYSVSTGAFFLRNANAGGPADLVFTFGPGGAGFTPVAGDWDGDGSETIGIYQIATGAFFLRNTNANGGADLVFSFGPGGSGFVPVTGDWNGDGTDTIGIRLQSSGVFFLRDSNSAGPADATFGYGAGGETPVAGNWAG